MLISLTLTNFGKVEQATMTFDRGMTAIRGANEAGKSTRYNAIMYAFFGARALPQSLAETVTWGRPDSSLRVILVFSHNGITYTINRAKSGAVLLADNLKVSGHEEVTKYVQGLFEVDASMAAKIMVASQDDLRASLDSKSTVQMIEKLADISIIDDIVQQIKETLPNGDTALLIEQLRGLENLVEPSKEGWDKAKAATESYSELLTEATSKLQVAKESYDAKALQRSVTELAVIDDRIKQRATILANIEAITQELAIPLEPFNPAELERLLQAQAEAKNYTSMLVAYRKFLKCPGYAGEHWKSYEEWSALVAAADAKHQELVVKKGLLNVAIATERGALILQDSCALCGKDLKNVPEVTEKNVALHASIERLQAELDEVTASIKQSIQDISALKANDPYGYNHTLSSYESQWTILDKEMWPYSLKWATEDVPTDNVPDYTSQIQTEEAKKRAHHQQVNQRDLARLRKQEFEEALEASMGLESKIEPLKRLIAQQEVLRDNLTSITETHIRLTAEHEAALNAEKVQRSIYMAAVEKYAKDAALKESLNSSLAEMNKNNVLIRDLRAARPKVAAQLWQIVLSTMAHYFSAIRGTPSVVTIENNVFQVDGHPAEAQSGSTRDSLALAIRIALGKTFLPAIDFLLLDEPARGMDQTREAAMLGTLSTVDYAQIVVVTHSDQCGVFARNLIEI